MPAPKPKPKEHFNKYKLEPIRDNAPLDLTKKFKSALEPEPGCKVPLTLEGNTFIDKFIFYLSKANPSLLREVQRDAELLARKEKSEYKQALGKTLSILIARLGLRNK